MPTNTISRELLELHEELYVAYLNHIGTETERLSNAMSNPREVLREDLRYMLKHTERFAVFVAEKPAIVGYITGHVDEDLRRVWSRKGMLGDWFVQENSRGQGIGKALYCALEKFFQGRGCDQVESSTWASNKLALAAHHQLGFSDCRVVMRKKIVPDE